MCSICHEIQLFWYNIVITSKMRCKCSNKINMKRLSQFNHRYDLSNKTSKGPQISIVYHFNLQKKTVYSTVNSNRRFCVNFLFNAKNRTNRNLLYCLESSLFIHAEFEPNKRHGIFYTCSALRAKSHLIIHKL